METPIKQAPPEQPQSLRYILEKRYLLPTETVSSGTVVYTELTPAQQEKQAQLVKQELDQRARAQKELWAKRTEVALQLEQYIACTTENPSRKVSALVIDQTFLKLIQLFCNLPGTP